MASSDDWKKTVRVNKILGMWAAEKLGLKDPDAEAYSTALALATLDPKLSNVLDKICRDFDAAGIVQSEEEILSALNAATLQAGDQAPGSQGDVSDALTVTLVRKIKGG